jgi:hypothetical protein
MITEAKAASFFKPIQADLVKLILESWKRVHSTDLTFKARARACLMWDEIFGRVNLAFCDSPHIDKIETVNNQTARYWLDQTTFFRIKKGDSKGYTSNYPTQTAMEFHVEQSDLFGATNRLELIYILNGDETEIVDVAVVHRNGGKIDFMFSLLSEENVHLFPSKEDRSESVESQSNVAKLKPGLVKEEKPEQGNE